MTNVNWTVGTDGNDELFGTDSVDLIEGHGGNDRLFGYEGNDTLKGGAGNDYLDGGTGADRMEGGTGSDTYVVDDAGDEVVELAGEGYDWVLSYVDYTLGANVEALQLMGTARVGVGNSLNNKLIGNDMNNELHGGGGSDYLDGGYGADMLVGGTGSDGYVVDNVDDLTIEAAGEGIDTVHAHIDWRLSANVERLHLKGMAVVGHGNELKNDLYGNDFDNELFGEGGNDYFNGGRGADRMHGGVGNDIYVVDNAGDQTVELAGEGHDWVHSSVSWTLGANVEDLQLTGTAELDGVGNNLTNRLVGNGAANRLEGVGGNDTLRGGAGNDTLVASFHGQTGIYAWGDLLDGGMGADTLYGGGGGDRFVVDNVGDVVVETNSFAYGPADQVHTSLASYGLGANLEQLYYTGRGDFEGFGNELENLIQGGNGSDTLWGGSESSGGDVVYGLAGNDSLFGEGGSDMLTGGSGDDQLDGGDGSDELYGDDQGSTTVGGSDILVGGAGDDRMIGGLGADAMRGGEDNDELWGDSGVFGDLAGDADVLDGGAGDDTLWGQGGADQFVASTGNDVIGDFELAGGDVVDLASFVQFTSFADVQAAMMQTGWDVYVNLGDGSSLTLRNVDAATLTSQHFLLAA